MKRIRELLDGLALILVEVLEACKLKTERLVNDQKAYEVLQWEVTNYRAIAVYFAKGWLPHQDKKGQWTWVDAGEEFICNMTEDEVHFVKMVMDTAV